MKFFGVIKKNIHQLFFVILAFALMVTISFISLYGMLQRNISVNAEWAMDKADKLIQAEMIEAEVTIINAALTVADRFVPGEDNSEWIIDYFVAMSESLAERNNTRVTNIGDVYGYIDEVYVDGSLWDPTDPVDGFLDDEGNLLPYIPTERDWYIVSMEAPQGEVAITQPYVDAMTGEVVISLSVKTYRNGVFIGVIAFDVDISRFAENVKEL
ncbi:MAG: hypothetical protein FWG45_07370, partial [Oscillospiraceae bacterium]|nr:hypothetical protein [Oscillospiraceae bacterium]